MRAHPLTALSAATLAALAIVVGGGAAAHGEESVTVDFGTGYALGDDHPTSAEGWNTWSHPAARYDWALVETTDFPGAGLPPGVALRFSNSVNVDGQFGNINQLTSPLIEAAGEPTTGAVNNTFETSFTIASTTGALQPRLALTVNLDNGAGSRSGGTIAILHTATGLQFQASGPVYGAPSAVDEDWTTAYSADYDPTIPHAVRIVGRYVTDGPDVVELYVDGALALTAPGYEAYHLAAGSTDASKQSRGVLFRASRLLPGTPETTISGFSSSTYPDSSEKAALLGKGFLIADLAYRSYNVVPTTPPVGIPSAPPAPTGGATALDVDESEPHSDTEVSVEATGMEPGELVGFTAYSAPVFLGYGIADPTGTARLVFTPKAVGLEAGAHTIVATGVTSARIATTSLAVLALAETGREAREGLPWLLSAVTAALLGVLVLIARAHASRRSSRAAI